jgi:hypothetical protein
MRDATFSGHEKKQQPFSKTAKLSNRDESDDHLNTVLSLRFTTKKIHLHHDFSLVFPYQITLVASKREFSSLLMTKQELFSHEREDLRR